MTELKLESMAGLIGICNKTISRIWRPLVMLKPQLNQLYPFKSDSNTEAVGRYQ